MKIKSAAAAGAAAGLLLLASPAFSQAWIGTMVGQMAAEQKEQHCQAHRRPAESERIEATDAINALMLKLRTPDAPAKNSAKLFSKRKGAKVANATQLISQEELRVMLGVADTPGEWKHLVIAVDNLSGRGVWRIARPAVDGAPEEVREFGFDFVREWGTWKIHHAQEYPGPLFAPEPDIYCHAWNTSSY